MSIDGTYDIVVRTLKGQESGRWVLVKDGTALTGTSERLGEVAELMEGVVDGNDFQFKVKTKTPLGRIKITFKGTVEGDRIFGKAKTPLGSMPFEGSRI